MSTNVFVCTLPVQNSPFAATSPAMHGQYITELSCDCKVNDREKGRPGFYWFLPPDRKSYQVSARFLTSPGCFQAWGRELAGGKGFKAWLQQGGRISLDSFYICESQPTTLQKFSVLPSTVHFCLPWAISRPWELKFPDDVSLVLGSFQKV